LLDGNVSRKNIDYQSLTPKKCQLLIGAEYLLLDPLCYNISEKKRHGSLCFLGGGDNQEDLKRIIPLLSSLTLPQPITCIFGVHQPNTKSLIALCQKHRCQSIISPSNFKALCQTTSLAIVRCGLVSYELAAFKTPNVVIFQKGIHEEVARWLETKDYAYPMTINNFLNPESANSSIEKALNMNPTQALQAIPGALKVAQHILKVGNP
jgi:spore coat polysaccharide biosynthesis predicted glycosyltransferase SpsG